MARPLIVTGILVLCSLTASAQNFDRFFTTGTLRLDYYHSGTKGEESFSLDQALAEGPWPGSRINLLDTLNLGEYLLRVYDHATGQPLYSRGFSTIFQEWQSTDEAIAGIRRTFSESVRFPFPKRTVQVTLSRRDRYLNFRELFSTVIDPADRAQIRKEKPGTRHDVLTLLRNGPSEQKVDIVILGDGYTREDMTKFRKDAKRFTDVLFATHPFDRRKNDFNVWGVEVPSSESGIDLPDRGIWKGTALGTTYNTFGSARYILTTENKAVREAAASAQYDFICILVNDSRYGGGGIFQLYATTYSNETVQGWDWQMDYVFVHEFGHSFAGLGDEYYTSSVAYSDFYPPGVEPWEPNVTPTTDRTKLKWAKFVSQDTELPTQWAKAQYDSIAALRGKLDRLAPGYYQRQEPYYRAAQQLLKDPLKAGTVGAFEGAGYATKGLYRPSLDCRMFSLSTIGFDPVCSEAINRMVDFYSR